MLALLASTLLSPALLSSAVVLAAEDGGGASLLLLAGPVAGGLAYVGCWSYYRNTGKSHAFERETRVNAKPVAGSDTKVGEVKGTTKSDIDGANHTDHRSRVQRM